MREEEAKKKWCPMSRHPHVPTDRKFPDPPLGMAKCLASDCAWWQWEGKMKVNGFCGLVGSNMNSEII